jgi:hypothetical protein
MIVLLNSPGIVRGFLFYRSHECPLWVKADIIELLHESASCQERTFAGFANN